jgi:hypothetical protein
MAKADKSLAGVQNGQQGFRLDPAQTRHRLTRNENDIRLEASGAVVKRQLTCGAPLSMMLPNRAFQGVAATALENGDGTQTMTLELRHGDPALSIPLANGTDAEQIVADWTAWAQRCQVPMLIIGANGEAEVVGARNAAARDTGRRRRITEIATRPRFLRRRKLGRISPITRIDAREIIARS